LPLKLLSLLYCKTTPSFKEQTGLPLFAAICSAVQCMYRKLDYSASARTKRNLEKSGFGKSRLQSYPTCWSKGCCSWTADPEGPKGRDNTWCIVMHRTQSSKACILMPEKTKLLVRHSGCCGVLGYATVYPGMWLPMLQKNTLPRYMAVQGSVFIWNSGTHIAD
jgi:hypothetical protein